MARKKKEEKNATFMEWVKPMEKEEARKIYYSNKDEYFERAQAAFEKEHNQKINQFVQQYKQNWTSRNNIQLGSSDTTGTNMFHSAEKNSQKNISNSDNKLYNDMLSFDLVSGKKELDFLKNDRDEISDLQAERQRILNKYKTKIRRDRGVTTSYSRKKGETYDDFIERVASNDSRIKEINKRIFELDKNGDIGDRISQKPNTTIKLKIFRIKPTLKKLRQNQMILIIILKSVRK